MKFKVDIRRREGLSDPEGLTTARALADLGYDNVSGVSFGRSLVVEVSGTDEATAKSSVEEMCERLLANPVIEDFDVTLVADHLPEETPEPATTSVPLAEGTV